MKNKRKNHTLRKIIAGLCIVAIAISLPETISDLLFEFRYLGEWGYGYLLYELFITIMSGAGIFVLSDYISRLNIDAESERLLNEGDRYDDLRISAEEEFENARAQVSEPEEEPEEEDEIDPDELAEMLRNDFSEKNKNMHG